MPSPPVRNRGVAGLAWSAVPALITFVCAGVFLVSANTITGPEATYPVVLAIAVLAVGLINLVRDLLTRTRPEHGEDAPVSAAAARRLVAFVAVLVAALVLLEPAGFFPAMVVMVIGSLVCFGVRNPTVIAAATALIVGYSYLIFVRLLAVPFPPGFLGLT